MRSIALILAGGNGTRLHPLTVAHAKPAVTFALGCRIIDFVFSNPVNTQIASIYVPHSLTPGQEMDQNAAKAKNSDGVQELTLPKKPGSAGKEIKVSQAAPKIGAARAIAPTAPLFRR